MLNSTIEFFIKIVSDILYIYYIFYDQDPARPFELLILFFLQARII